MLRCNKIAVNDINDILEPYLNMRVIMKTIMRYKGVFTLAIGILMIIAGVMRGEPATVLTKAVNICLECIGIG